MAVVSAFTDSVLAAGIDKTTNLLKNAGIVTVKSKAWESAAADSDGSVYVVFPIPSNAIPLAGGTVRHDSITNGTSFSYGVYEKNDAGAFVVGEGDIGFFKAAATHANTTVNDPFELAMTVDNDGKMVWELLGLSTDPNKMFYWAITAATVGDGGTFNVSAQYLHQG